MSDTINLEYLEYLRNELNLSYRDIAKLTNIRAETVFRNMTEKSHNFEKLEIIYAALKDKIDGKKGILKNKKAKEALKMINLPQYCLDHFNLKTEPFTAGEVPMYRNEVFDAAINTLLNAALKNQFLLLKGSVGAGKSTVVTEVRKQLKLKYSQKIKLIYIRPTFVEHITDSFIANNIITQLTGEKAPQTFDSKTNAVAHAINRECQKNRSVCIMIDEAHRLRPNALRSFKRWWEGLGSHEGKMGIILIAQPNIKPLLESSDLTEVRYRLAICDFDPFQSNNGKNLEEYRKYIEFKLKNAGVTEPIFTDEAIEQIAIRCDTPLEINCLCNHALLQAANIQEKTVGYDILNSISGI